MRFSFSIFWHLISISCWFTLLLFWNFLNLILSANNQNVNFGFSIIGSVILFGLLQEILINRIMKIFPYWFMIVISGIVIGIIYGVLFLLSSLTLVLLAGSITVSIERLMVNML